MNEQEEYDDANDLSVPEEVIVTKGTSDENDNNSLFKYGSLPYLVLCDEDNTTSGNDNNFVEREVANDGYGSGSEGDGENDDGDSDAGHMIHDIDWDVFIERTRTHPNEIDIDPLIGVKGYYPDLRESMLHFILRYHNPVPTDALESIMVPWRENQINHHYYNYHNRISLLYIACIINQQQSSDVIGFLLREELDAIKRNCIIPHNPLYFLTYDNSIDISVLQTLLEMYPQGVAQDDGRDALKDNNDGCTSESLCRDYSCTYDHRSNGYLPAIIDQRILCNCQRNYLSEDLTPISSKDWEKKFLYLKVYNKLINRTYEGQKDMQPLPFYPVHVILKRLFHKNFITTVTLPLCQMSIYFSSYYDNSDDKNNNDAHEDNNSWFVIDFLKHITDNDPRQFTFTSINYNILPLHYVLQQKNHNHIPTHIKIKLIEILLTMYPKAASILYPPPYSSFSTTGTGQSHINENKRETDEDKEDHGGRLPLHVCLENGWSLTSSNIWRLIFEKAPQALQTRDVKTHLYPFQISATSACISSAIGSNRSSYNSEVTTSYVSSNSGGANNANAIPDTNRNDLSNSTSICEKESTSALKSKEIDSSFDLMCLDTTYDLLRRDPSILEQYII